VDVGDAALVLRPAPLLRRAAALALDVVLLGWFFAWLLLPFPGLSPWVVLVLTGAYTVAGEGRRGHTLGKKALALEVWSADGEGPAGTRRALVRFGARAAPVVPLVVAATLAPALTRAAAVFALAGTLADHAWALTNPLGRTAHDLVAGTVVLRRPREPLFRLGSDHPWASGGGR
jgi:uncharacterized RDD family membrane protein YckC